LAIYRLSSKIITRSKGHSVVACAAYRAGENLFDDRTGVSQNYTNKEDVVFSEIILPAGAPDWMKSREKLWNTVELMEKRKDSQLAREVQLALPRELTLSQNVQLTQEFVKEKFVSAGMVADINIHIPIAADGGTQPHAHVLLTMRKITDDNFGLKAREWNQKCELEMWREEWGQYVNKHLAINGHDLRVDHRSLEEQGIDLEPQKKIGPTSAFHRMAAYGDHQKIVEENGKRLLSRPEIIFDVLTNQQSTFTHHDIARIINRYTVDANQFDLVYERVKLSPELVALGTDDKNRERFTTRGMLKLESEMVTAAMSLNDKPGHFLKEEDLSSIITAHQLSPEQSNALDYMTGGGDLKTIVGYAGTGKSRMLGAAREVWEQSGYRVLGATLSGIAAENLEASSEINSRTLASRFHYWDKGQELLTAKDILVIDEAGMIGSKEMASVIHEVEKHGAKVILVGDPEQLQAIGAGAAFRSILKHTSFGELTEIRRQKEEWQREATIQFATRNTAEAIEQYIAHDAVHEFETNSQAKHALVDAWNDGRISGDDKTQIMLAYTRKDVLELNQMARGIRISLDEIKDSQLILTERGERQFAEGERIYFLKNDRDLGVKNGTLGTILNIENNQLKVKIDKEGAEESIIQFSTDRYNHLDYGYAATIHKGQGVTVDRSYVLASEYLDRHATYVAMSRHRESTELFWSKELFPDHDALVVSLSRERSKDTSLDYSVIGFAKERDIEIEDWVKFKSYPSTPEWHKDLFYGMDKGEDKTKGDWKKGLFIGMENNEKNSLKSEVDKHRIFDDKEIEF